MKKLKMARSVTLTFEEGCNMNIVKKRKGNQKKTIQGRADFFGAPIFFAISY
jgi:hypothetical protein